MKTAYLCLGSNMGERISFIENAISSVDKISKTELVKSSKVYETEPWGVTSENNYLNCVIEIRTGLSAENLLSEIKQLEKKLGRTESRKWSDREIDIDILFYGNEIIRNELVIIPHVLIEKRKFVLVPLNEIASSLIHPESGKSISELLTDTEDKLEVTLYKTAKV